MESKILKLINKVEKAIENDEYGITKINGVKCSRADLETLQMLLNYYIKNGSFGNFMILGEVKEVLQKNNML